MKKTKILLLLLILIPFLLTGCTNDSMDNIEIIVTNYPNEYIVKNLYGKHSTISSIYPDGVDINEYTISKKQKEEFAKKDLFVYNGLIEKERELALDLLEKNPDLKIIDTAYVLETDYSPEELWLNPSSLLMMSQNIRIGLVEYITNTYLQKEVNDDYEELKIKLSEIDAEYRLAVESTNNKTILVANNSLKYLEKFGLNVICVDSDATQKAISDAEQAIESNQVSYLFLFKKEEPNENAAKLLEKYPDLKRLEIHKLDNISDEERSAKKDYLTIIGENLEAIKSELYQ